MSLITDFKTFKLGEGDYKVNRRIFQAIFIIMFLIFLIMGSVYGFKSEHIYYSCKNKPACTNPFYQEYRFSDRLPPEMISSQFLDYGYTFGKPAPSLISNFGIIFTLLILIGFVSNHFLYNNGFILSPVAPLPEDISGDELEKGEGVAGLSPSLSREDKGGGD
jgi:hypothetical protein